MKEILNHIHFIFHQTEYQPRRSALLCHQAEHRKS